MMAGSDFIKTSTGKEPVNAVLPVGLVMCRAIREYQEKTGRQNMVLRYFWWLFLSYTTQE